MENAFSPTLRLLRRLGLRPAMAILLLTDALALEATALLVFVLRSLLPGELNSGLYMSVMPLLLLGPLLNVALNTSQSIALPPHKEIKQLFLATSFTYLLVLAYLFVTQEATLYSRLVVGGAWLCSLISVPTARGRVRRWLSAKPWWGRPVVFLRRGAGGEELWDYLETHPQRGLRPVDMVHVTPDQPDLKATLSDLRRRHPDAVALLCLDGRTQDNADFIRQVSLFFGSMLLVPPLTSGEGRFWLTPRDLGCAVGLLVRQNLLDARRLRAKRYMDLFITLLSSPVVIPLGLFLALCIRLDSKGSPLYAQHRIGQNGKPIRVFKFRTMICNADALLHTHLEANPELRDEWEANQKLRDDPRVTRMGAFLRKTSLDELPQLWNVFSGSMSLVGPRPIVEKEIDRYGKVYTDYSLVKPGITGLWQVSGRNNTTYAERIRLDHYYVTNWSVWMDIWILARTIPVVLLGKGAY